MQRREGELIAGGRTDNTCFGKLNICRCPESLNNYPEGAYTFQLTDGVHLFRGYDSIAAYLRAVHIEVRGNEEGLAGPAQKRQQQSRDQAREA